MANQSDTGKKTRLQYYDGWNAEYIYFSSLLKAPWGGAEKGYNEKFINEKKDEAIKDAQQHLYLPDMDADKSFEEFTRQFKKIKEFLLKAYRYEQKNEEDYFNNKYKELINTFSEEEREQIPELKECIKILQNGIVSFDYKKFITLINILQTGLTNTKTIANYEAKRIKKIEDTLDSIINKKNNQTIGLADKKNWEDRDKRINKIQKRFQRNIEIEYAKTGRLNQKNQKTGRYFIRGAYAFSDIQQTAERELGKWAENALKSIQNNKEIIAKLAEVITKQYPLDGDFNKLTDEVRRVIIIGVLQYGRQHLDQILNHRKKPIIIEDMVKDLTDENNHIFDMVQEFNLKGLPDDFGQNIQEARLARDISEINSLSNQSAEELYNSILNLIKKEESIMDDSKQKSSYLILAMKRMSDAKLGTKYDETLELISLVEETRRLLEEQEKISSSRKKKTEEYSKEYKVTTHSGKTATVKVAIQNGKPTVDMEALNRLVTDTKLYQKSNATSLSNLLRSLTTNASKKLRANIIESLNKARDDQLLGYSEKDILSALDSELKTIDIKIDGPKLEEFFSATDFTTTKNGRVIWNGRRNNKNDVVTIQFGSEGEISAFTQRVLKDKKASRYKKKRAVFLQEEISKAQQDLVLAIQETADRELQKVIHNNNKTYSSSDRYSFFSKFTPQNAQALAKEYNDKDEPIAKAWEKLMKITNSYKTFIHNRNEFVLEKQIKKRILHNLNNSLQISTTVKAFNTYNNKMGFVGGSLGSNLQTQINTIADIFQSAGLPMVDLKWLYSAILNCAPTTVVGEANKSLIESYLGAVAAFALFDEGGTESMYISKTYETFFNSMKTSNAQKILHLYKLNGIYVPGSFIIKRTVNTLDKEVIPQLTSLPKIMHKGAGITIINTASMGDITGNGEGTWAATGQAASKNVSIQILFLAQFLDVINSINKELGNTLNVS